jgi:CRP/FNR family transcriptional regulator
VPGDYSINATGCDWIGYESNDMGKILHILKQAPLFSGLADDELEKVRSIADDQFYDRGKTVFFEGDDGDGFYIVASGKVKIFKVSHDGKEKILHIYGPGHPFGEVPVFSGSRFPAHAQTLLKSHLLFFARDHFVSLISAHPSLAINMLGVISLRLREFSVQIENLSLKEVPGRLAAYLLYLSKEQTHTNQAGEYQVRLTISKVQLASILGTIPETLSRIFAKMSQQHLLSVEGRDILLHDIEGLQSLSKTGKMPE